MRLSRESLFEAAASEAKRFGYPAPGPLHLALVIARTEPMLFERAFGTQAAAIVRKAVAGRTPSGDARSLLVLLEAWESEDVDAFLSALAQSLPPELRPSDSGAPPDWASGAVLAGTYKILGVAGVGGMGIVHRVRHLQWDIDLAVKSPSADVDLAAFEHEADTWIGLGLHPHVCVCHYVRRLDGMPRLFAEYAGGGSVGQCMRDRTLYAGAREIVLERLLDLAIQFARGLAHAHERGVVHQDVKPANLLLDDDGVAKLSDFGIARAAAPGLPVTMAGFTEPYCSPEQAATDRCLTSASDVWSFAVSVLAFFAGGAPTRRGPNAGRALDRIAVADDPVLPRLPAQLADLLRRCLQDRPTQRPQIGEAAHELEGIYEHVVGRAYPRAMPDEAMLRAGELSNHALSMLDLKRPNDAERMFEQALQLDPQHPQATYNRGLYEWRQALIADDEVVRRLTALRGPEAERLLALAHLERGDPTAAYVLLDAAEAGGLDVSQARAAATATRPTAGLMGALQSRRGGIASIAIVGGQAFTASRGWSGSGECWDLRTGRLTHTLPGPDPEPDAGHIGATVSADGTLALFACADGSLSAWELADPPHRLGRIEPPDIDLAAIALSGDGRVLVAAGTRDTVVWDLTRDTLAGRRLGIPLVTGLALSGNGQVAVSGHVDGRVQAWDTADGRILGTVQAPWAPLSVALARYGVLALVGGVDGNVGVWDIRGRRWTVRTGHTSLAMSVDLTPDGRLGVTGGYDGTLRVWDCAAGRCLRTLDADAEVSAVALAPDGETAISGDVNGALRAWHLRAELPPPPAPWSLTRPRPIGEGARADARFREGLAEVDRLLAAGAAMAAAERLRAIRDEPEYAHDPLVLERWHAVTRRGRRRPPVRVWEWRAVQEVRRVGPEVGSLALSRDGAWMLTTGGGGGASVWALADGRRIASLENPLIHRAVLTADGQRAFTGAHDGCVQFWDAGTGVCLWRVEGHADRVRSVALARRGRVGLSAGSDNVARLWDLESGANLASWRPGHELTCMAIQEDGSHAVAGCGDGALRIWSLDGGVRPPLLGHTDAVSAIVLTRDGRQAVTAGFDHSARVWDLVAGKCTHVLGGHMGPVYGVAVSADGKLAVTGSWDRSVKLWDLGNRACLVTLPSPGPLSAVAMTPDGRLAAAGGADLHTRVWQLDWECEFPEHGDWDEAARWVVELFARTHPGEHLDILFEDLQDAGFGWLARDAVRSAFDRR